MRPVERVVAEVERLVRGKTRCCDRVIFFVDDNIVAVPRFAKELFRALIPLDISWVSQGTIHTFTSDDELLSLAAASGCLCLFIGLETVSTENLKSINKSFAKGHLYAENLAKIHRHGIGVLGSFIFGLEHDDERVFQRTVEFAQANAIEAANFSILTPYPGTRLAKRYEAAGKILSRDWSQYHALTDRVLIDHERLSADLLLRGTAWSWIRYYSMRAILGRLWKTPRTMLKNAVVVHSYRKRALALRRAGYGPDCLHLPAAAG